MGGVAEQRDFIGNIVWGQSMSDFYYPESVSQFGAMVQGIALSELHQEDPRDSVAIAYGYDRAQGAAGGFLLYPNKSNTNLMSRIWSKP